MKQKENIFEELNKMRNLIHTRPGVVISEQVDASADAGAIMRELNKSNSDEASIVNIIKKYKDKASFNNFINQYKTISGKDFGADIMRAITPVNDKTEWNDLKTHLSSLGVALTSQVRDPRQGGSYAIFGGLTPQVSSEDKSKVEEMWKDPKVSCVINQPSAKKEVISNGSIAYLIGNVRYYANGRKQSADGTMTNYNCSTEFKSRGASNPGGRANTSSLSVNDRFTKTAQSLGVQNAKMDVATLQTMLKSLQGDTTTASPTQGTPDIEQLKAALNQLKQ